MTKNNTPALPCERPKVICFDADDTLWHNEEYYQEAEQRFCELLSDYGAKQDLFSALFAQEMQNMDLLGYGSKAFTISMIEAALKLTQDQLPISLLKQLIALGKENIAPPMVLFPQAETCLQQLRPHFRLALATKGDLRDQERKLERSGLAHYFEDVFIVSEKDTKAYQKIIHRLGISTAEFMMVGNSFKSDILPVLAIGGRAVYIPSAVLWLHEQVEITEHPDLHTLTRLDQLPEYVNTLG